MMNGSNGGYNNGDIRGGMSSNRGNNLNGTPGPLEYSKMARNDSKSSGNFNNQMEIKKQQTRIMNLNNGDSVPPSALEGASPDLSQRKMNAKVGVTLAPLHH